MEVKIYIPHLSLREYVLNISTVQVVLPEGMTEAVTPYPPTPFQSLLFYSNDPVQMGGIGEENFEDQPLTVLVGPQFSRVNVKVVRQLNAIRVDFLPGGLYRMLGIPMHELFDTGYDASDFFGAPMKDLQERLNNTTNLAAGKEMVEGFLLSYVNRLKEILPIDHAMKMLLNSNGLMTMEKAAYYSCLSLKQFERKCQERIGMNPKMYARILRFSKAYRMHEMNPALSWLHIAHEAGYYDQMHMIRDFKIFAGVNPSVIEQELRTTPIKMQKDLRI
ncbi:MAG: AraC family transcriptional regulator [Chitinophagaceae bacterium]|nr:MAG: AraC family transcriptional regulator [Chitinophagaceae bacterium]